MVSFTKLNNFVSPKTPFCPCANSDIAILRHAYRRAVRPPEGAVGLLGKHIWDAHEGFRLGILGRQADTNFYDLGALD